MGDDLLILVHSLERARAFLKSENLLGVDTGLLPEQPHHLPSGIKWVIVNGTVVMKDEAHTGAKPGYVPVP